jgi:GT2 family glycosyltransferase
MKPKVVVIVVIWNGLEDTLECLRSLLQENYPNFEILVVDNGSTDGSADVIRQKQFPVRLISVGANLGFTGGNNIGLIEAQRLGARYAFLLNNDTTLEKGLIRSLVDAAEANPDTGIVAPVMHYYDEPRGIWFAGGKIVLSKGEACHDASLFPSRRDGPYQTSWVSGCAMLVRIIALDQVGGFDDRFYLSWEDVDWCLRMQKEGWKVAVVPRARIFHKGGRSGQRLANIGSYYAVRNSLLLSYKHAGFGYFSALLHVLAFYFKAGFRAKPGERQKIFATTVEGLRDHLLQRYGKRRPKISRSHSRRAIGEAALETVLERREISAIRTDQQ